AGQSNLVAMAISAAVSQVLNTSTDYAHRLSPQLNVLLFSQKDRGLLYGPYHPRYDHPPEQRRAFAGDIVTFYRGRHGASSGIQPRRRAIQSGSSAPVRNSRREDDP